MQDDVKTSQVNERDLLCCIAYLFGIWEKIMLYSFIHPCKHANSAQEGQKADLQPTCCEATALTTAMPSLPMWNSLISQIVKLLIFKQLLSEQEKQQYVLKRIGGNLLCITKQIKLLVTCLQIEFTKDCIKLTWLYSYRLKKWITVIIAFFFLWNCNFILKAGELKLKNIYTFAFFFTSDLNVPS